MREIKISQWSVKHIYNENWFTLFIRTDLQGQRELNSMSTASYGKRNFSLPRYPPHFPQLKTTLNKSIEFWILDPAPALVSAGLDLLFFVVFDPSSFLISTR